MMRMVWWKVQHTHNTQVVQRMQRAAKLLLEFYAFITNCKIVLKEKMC